MGKILKDVCAKIIRVALYIRVSHEEQAKHGLSLDAQIKALKNYAKEKGWKVVDVYADEGITARKKLSKRKEFQRLMSDVKADKIDMIIFIKLDRWFRNVPDYYETQKILDEHNVGWVATEEEYDTTTANGRLHLNIKLSIAQNESDQTSDRIRFVFANRVKEGFVVSGAKKMGYDIVDKKFVVNEKEAEILNELYDYYLKIGSLRQTMFYYNDKYDLYAKHETIRKWLTDTAYIGEYRNCRGELIANYTPPIIPIDKFEAVQNRLEANQRASKKAQHFPESLFDGMIVCPLCQKRFARKIQLAKNKHAPDRMYVYYRCWKSGKIRKETGKDYACKNTIVCKESNIEDHLLQNFKKLAENYITKNTIIDEVDKKDSKKKKNSAESIKNKIEKLQTLYIENLIDMEDYKKRYSVLNAELQSITDEMKKEKQSKPKDLSKVKKILNENVQELYNSLDYQDKRRFWFNTIDKIYVKDGQIVDVAFL